MTDKVDGLPLQKECPNCNELGTANGDGNGNHIGSWSCDNDECHINDFVHSDMVFYRQELEPSLENWTWEDITEMV